MNLCLEFDAELAAAEIVHGKRVSVVGGSDSWDRRAETAEMCVRVNFQNWMRQGGRADALFTSVRPELKNCNLEFVAVDIDTDWAPMLQAKLLARRIPCVGFTAEETRHDWRCQAGPQFEWCNRFCKELATLPLTGMIAIHWLQRLSPAEIFLTGFDFYREASGHIEPFRSSHAVLPQIAWLKREIEMDRRLVPDAALTEALGL